MEDLDSSFRPRRIVVAYNVDFQDRDRLPEGDGFFSLAADAEVAQTAHDIASVLADHGHEIHFLQINDGLDHVLPQLLDFRADLVFNLVESIGNDPAREHELPAMLQKAGIPYTGNSASALRLAHTKDLTRHLLEAHRIPTPAGIVVRHVHDIPDDIQQRLRFPLFVKPARADASIGIDQGSLVHDPWGLAKRVAWLTRHVPGPALIEQYLPGPEVNVALFPNPFDGQAVATEIDFSGCPADLAPIVTYDCKWSPDSPEYVAASRACIDRFPPALYREIQRVARAAFLVVGGSSYGRVDLRLDADGRPAVIDINPNPDLDREAGMAIAAASAHLDYSSLLREITHDGLRNHTHVAAPNFAARPRALGRPASAR